MSYCRFSDGDVYLFYHVNGFYDCCGCRLNSEKTSFNTPSETLEHLKEHIAAGHDVPGYAIKRLKQEIAELSRHQVKEEKA